MSDDFVTFNSNRTFLTAVSSHLKPFNWQNRVDGWILLWSSNNKMFEDEKNKEVHLLGLWETDSGCSITMAAWQVRCSSSVMVNKYAFQDFFSPANILPLYRRIMPSSHVCELDKKGVHFQSNTKWNKINISLCVKTCFTVLNALAIFIQPL